MNGQRQRQNAKDINYVVECECYVFAANFVHRLRFLGSDSIFFSSTRFWIFVLLVVRQASVTAAAAARESARHSAVPQVHPSILFIFLATTSYTWRFFFSGFLFSTYSHTVRHTHTHINRWCCNLPNYPLNIFQNVIINHSNEWKKNTTNSVRVGWYLLFSLALRW